MDILDKILNEFKDTELPVDIEGIIKGFGLKIIKTDLGKIDGILLDNFIGVNNQLTEYKQRFVIAHEFCHFILGEKGFAKGIYHSTNPKERRADDFATKILLPKHQLIEKYIEYQNIPTLVTYFGVPTKVIEKRLNNLFL